MRWIRDAGFPIRNAQGAIGRVGGISQDVTELHRTELRLRTFVEGIPQLVWRSEEGGDWTWASPQWTDYTGQTQEESRGRGWLDALHPEDRDMAEPGAAPRGGGNGRMLIERALPYQLGARTTYELRADGVRCTIDLPLR